MFAANNHTLQHNPINQIKYFERGSLVLFDRSSSWNQILLNCNYKMGDVAKILGVHNTSSKPLSNEAKNPLQGPPSAPASHIIPKSIQNTSVILNSKPLLKVLSSGQSGASTSSHSQKILSTSLPPIVPSHNLPLQTTKKVFPRDASNNTPPPHTSISNNTTSTNQIQFVKINNKAISTKKARSWVYSPFTNSARKDGLKLHHWVRAGVEYPEYPYARFNVHLEELSYRNEVLEIENANSSGNSVRTMSGSNSKNNNHGVVNGNSEISTAVQNRTEEEINAAADFFYEQHLQDKEWSQSETDTLLELCRVYQLRWPVIIDRWIGKFGTLSSKKVEDLQHRYYTIGYILNRMKVERAAKVEAENLAKAMAVAAQSVPSMGVMGGIGNIGGGGVVGQSTTLDDVKENETLKVKHMLSTAIAASTSNAITTLNGSEVKSNLQPPVPVPHTGTSNQPTFDLEAERQRREILDVIWARTKEEELEEIELRNELKLVEAQIRKMKKSGGHLIAAAAATKSGNINTAPGHATASSTNASGIDSKPSSRGQSPIVQNPKNSITDPSSSTTTPSTTTTNATTTTTGADPSKSNQILKQHFAPIPTPGTPYLQSGRQKQPSTNQALGINKTTLKRMDQVLTELKVKDLSLLPTKRVCDLYDHVRRDALVLLSLQKIMLKKENDVIGKRMRLEKMSNGILQQQREEANARAAALEAAAAAAKATAAEKAKNSAKTSGKSSSSAGSGNNNSGNKKSSVGTTGASSSSTTAAATTTTGTSSSNKKASSSSTSSKKGSSSKSVGKGAKEKKKKKEGGTTKKRKSTSKKKDSKASSSGKGSSGQAAASVATVATVKGSNSTPTAGGTGVVVAGNTAAAVSASAAVSSSPSTKKGNNSTLGNDGKPAKKRAKKSSSST